MVACCKDFLCILSLLPLQFYQPQPQDEMAKTAKWAFTKTFTEEAVGLKEVNKAECKPFNRGGQGSSDALRTGLAGKMVLASKMYFSGRATANL